MIKRLVATPAQKILTSDIHDAYAVFPYVHNDVISEKDFYLFQSVIALAFIPNEGQDSSTMDYVFENLESARGKLVVNFEEAKLRTWAENSSLYSVVGSGELYKYGSSFSHSRFEILRVFSDSPMPGLNFDDASLPESRKLTQLIRGAYALFDMIGRKYAEFVPVVRKVLSDASHSPDWTKLDGKVAPTLGKGLDPFRTALDRLGLYFFNLNPQINKPVCELFAPLYLLNFSERTIKLGAEVAVLSRELNNESLALHLEGSAQKGEPSRYQTQRKFWLDSFFQYVLRDPNGTSFVNWDEKQRESVLLKLIGVPLLNMHETITRDDIRAVVDAVNRESSYFFASQIYNPGPNATDKVVLRSITPLFVMLERAIKKDPSIKNDILCVLQDDGNGALSQFLFGRLKVMADGYGPRVRNAFQLLLFGELKPQYIVSYPRSTVEPSAKKVFRKPKIFKSDTAQAIESRNTPKYKYHRPDDWDQLSITDRYDYLIAEYRKKEAARMIAVRASTPQVAKSEVVDSPAAIKQSPPVVDTTQLKKDDNLPQKTFKLMVKSTLSKIGNTLSRYFCGCFSKTN